MIQSYRFRFLMVVYITIGFGAVLPLWVWKTLAGSSASVPGGLLALATCFVSALRLGQLAIAERRRLLATTFWLFVYVWLGIAPLAQILTGQFPHAGFYDGGRFVFVYLVVGTGLVSYELGHAFARRRAAIVAPRLRAFFESRQLNVARTLILSSLSIAVAAYLSRRIGGMDALIASRTEVFRSVQEFSGGVGQERLQPIMLLLRVPPFIAAYLLLCLWRNQARDLGFYSRPIGAILIVGSLALCLLTSNIFNAPRYWFGTIVLSIVFVLLPSRRSFSNLLVVVTILVALLLVFPYADLFRREIDPGAIDFRGVDPWIEKGDYDAYQQLLNAVIYVEQEGLQWGRQIGGSLLFWVPRSVWLAKPAPSGQLVAVAAGYDFTNLSMPLWGEAFLDGGLLLAALVFAVYGLGAGILEQLDREAETGNLAMYLVPLLAAYQLYLLRGALMSSFAGLVPMLVMIWLASSRR